MKKLHEPNNIRLILASASPRRRDLLAGLERPFDIISPHIDETAWLNEMPASFALRMAREKAMAVLAGLEDRSDVCVIAADTIVVLDQHILGKPRDAADAVATLSNLSGKMHTVITGLCVWHRTAQRNVIKGDAVQTSVTFRTLDEAEIRHYVASGEPMDKAGSYAIQGGAAGMVGHIDGSYSNVVGLPMETLVRLLECP